MTSHIATASSMAVYSPFSKKPQTKFSGSPPTQATVVYHTPFMDFLAVPSQGKYPWYFTDRPNSSGGAHTLTIVKGKDHKKYVLLIVMKRPALGGKLSVELPGGVRDGGESADTAAKRELEEETGYKVDHVQPLAGNAFAMSPGMTTETVGFSLANVNESSNKKEHDEGEQETFVRFLRVPLRTFENRRKFLVWLAEQEKAGHIVAMHVLAARGLMNTHPTVLSSITDTLLNACDRLKRLFSGSQAVTA